MTVHGYARVSTTDQDLTLQKGPLKNAGCEIILSKKVSGTSVSGKDELKTLLEFLRSGDELVVTRVDRWGRVVLDLQTIVRDLREKVSSLKPRSNLSTRQQAQGNVSSICLVCLRGSRRTSDGNANSRVSPKPKRKASIKVAHQRLIKRRLENWLRRD